MEWPWWRGGLPGERPARAGSSLARGVRRSRPAGQGVVEVDEVVDRQELGRAPRVHGGRLGRLGDHDLGGLDHGRRAGGEESPDREAGGTHQTTAYVRPRPAGNGEDEDRKSTRL